MILKWLTTIVLSLLVIGGVYLNFYSFEEQQALIEHKRELERVVPQLLARKNAITSHLSRVESWESLQQRAESAGLNSQDWIVNKLTISRPLYQQEMSRVLLFLSAGDNPVTSGYWFTPQQLSIMRLVDMGEGANQPAAQGQDDEEAAQPEDRFDFTVEGQFLIPKL